MLHFQCFYYCCSAIVALPKLTPEGCRVIVLRLIDTDPAAFDMDACLKFLALLCKYSEVRERERGSDVISQPLL